MCGIGGFILNDSPSETKKDVLIRMCDLMAHRGPDDSGYYFKDNVALGHRRLSIIDLSTGQQPMCSDDRKIWIVFNGEIYNFLDIRKTLESKGFKFKTNSDTEVLIKAYQCYGLEMLAHINGMFAFAIWDEEKKRLFAARDRLGKKPFYFFNGDPGFIFASELKSVIVNKNVPREIDPEAIDKYFSYGYIPSPHTIFKNIYKLRPGHFLIYQNNEVTVSQYWDVVYNPQDTKQSEDDYVDELHEILTDSVRSRLISDVPLGAFLSGGLDSSTIVAIMSGISNNGIKTFTINFEEKVYSEIEDARIVARHFDTDHREYTVVSEAMKIIPDLVSHFDEPFADSSAIPTYYVSKMARQDVTVILSGDGGDEMFAGYVRYMIRDRYEQYKKIPAALRQYLLGPVARTLPLNFKGKYFLMELSELEKIQRFEQISLFPQIKNYIFSNSFKRELVNLNAPNSCYQYWENKPGSPRLSEMQYFDTKLYLPDDILVKVDRMSMAHSLETRAPLLDYRIAEFAGRIPPDLQMKDGKGKYILRKLAQRILPNEILEKRKQGFGVPVREWFRNEMFDKTKEILSSERFKSRPYFNHKNVNRILDEHRKGKRDYSTWIWSLLMFELWYLNFIDQDTSKL